VPEVPEVFAEITDLIRVHLWQMRKLDRKPPVYASALLITIACEALGKLWGEGNPPGSFFAKRFLPRTTDKPIPAVVGLCLFDAIRNGIGHSYGTKAVVIGGTPIDIILSWSDRPHMEAVIGKWSHQRAPEHGLSLNVRTMERELYRLFKDLEAELLDSRQLAAKVQRNAPRVRETVRPQREALQEWRAFLVSVGWKKDRP
jgi:hypothetical protein